MNSSYKIALLAAFAVLAIVIGYYAFFSSDPSGTPDESNTVVADNNTPATGEGADRPAPPGNRLPPARVTPPIRPVPQPQPEPTPEPLPLPGNEITIGPGPGESLPPASGEEPIDPIDPVQPEPSPGIEVEPEPTPEPITPIIRPTPGPEVGPRPGPSITPPAPRPAPSPRTYTVQPGDTLSAIAEKIYNDPNAWVDIAQANGSVDPTRLQPGQVLILPEREVVVAPDREPAPVAPGQEQTYTIKPGDNLSSIAQQFYSDPDSWQIIYNRNRDRIGPSPDRLKAGMQIIIPPRYDGAN